MKPVPFHLLGVFTVEKALFLQDLYSMSPSVCHRQAPIILPPCGRYLVVGHCCCTVLVIVIVVSVSTLWLTCSLLAGAVLSQSLSMASTASAAVSTATWSRDSKPAPLLLSSGAASDETKSAPVFPSSTGGHDGSSSMPSTPLTDPLISRRQTTAFEVTSPVCTSTVHC